MTVAWSMSSAACLMLGLTCVMLWLRDPRRGTYLLAAIMALAAGASAMTELSLSRAPDIAAYERIIDLQVLLIFVLLTSLVWFIYAFLGTASRSLAVLISLLWVVHVAAQYLEPHGAVFTQVTGLDRLTLPWGEQFVLARGIPSPWKYFADAASLLIVIYVLHASVRAWRRGARRRVAVIGGAFGLFMIVAGIHTPLVDARLVSTPYMISFAFLAIVVAFTYQLVDEAITAARYARELEASEGRWRELLAALPLLAVTRDSAGIIQDVNAAMVQTTGFGREELIGQHFSKLVPDAEVPQALARFERAMGHEAPAPAVFQIRSRDGPTLSVAWSTVPLQNADGRTVGAISVGLDVTEQARAEANLMKARREMERLSRAMLLGEVSAGLAHELSQPLTAILSNAQAARRLLSRTAPDLGEIVEIVDDIIADDKRAGEVVHGLRAMLRPESAGHGQADLVEAIHRAASLLAGELRSHGVSLELRLEEDLRAVCGGTVQIQQVIMNLVLNAIRAMEGIEATRREIRVSSEAEDGQVVVSVADRGSGLDPSNMSRVFEPFVTTRGGGGLGMGLAICRRIVESSGGRIWAENRDGGGAVVRFTLPLATQHGTGAA